MRACTHHTPCSEKASFTLKMKHQKENVKIKSFLKIAPLKLKYLGINLATEVKDSRAEN